MKKLFVLIVLLAGASTATWGASRIAKVEVASSVCDFTPIDLKDLPETVRQAVGREFPEYTIQEAAVEESEDGSKTYEIVLPDPEGMRRMVFFNDEGKLVG